MADKNKKPEIRFQGYTDDWEQRKLGDFVIKAVDNRGKTPPTQEFGRYPLLEVASLGKASPDYTKVIKYVDEETYNGWFRAHIKKDDILFSTVGNTGLVTLMDGYAGATIAQNIVGFRAIEGNNPQFLVQMFQLPENLKRAKRIEMGAVQPSIKVSQLIHVSYLLPNSEQEQTKIGTFFKHLDDTIALHQRKLEKTKNMKKAMLDKMFPKEGKSIPEIRFTGFTEDWELCKLGEVSDIVGGGTPSTTIPEYWNGEIDWYSPAEIGEQIYVTNSVKKITALGLEKSSARILPIGTVLFTSRAGIGNTAILAKESCTNQGFQSIVPHKDSLDSYFIFSRTHELKRYGEVTGAGSTFVEVSGKQMAKMPLRIPSLEEQQKIGNFFKQIDDTIALHQSELQKLKNIKNSLLEKMFV